MSRYNALRCAAVITFLCLVVFLVYSTILIIGLFQDRDRLEYTPIQGTTQEEVGVQAPTLR